MKHDCLSAFALRVNLDAGRFPAKSFVDSKILRNFATRNKNKRNMANDTKKSVEQKKEKKVNRTWEAFGKWKGAFTIIDPKFLL